jgi:hypothetical protein
MPIDEFVTTMLRVDAIKQHKRVLRVPPSNLEKSSTTLFRGKKPQGAKAVLDACVPILHTYEISIRS